MHTHFRNFESFKLCKNNIIDNICIQLTNGDINYDNIVFFLTTVSDFKVMRGQYYINFQTQRGSQDCII